MNNNRLGCLSPSAIVASIITLLVIVGFGLFSGSGFFTAAVSMRAPAQFWVGSVRMPKLGTTVPNVILPLGFDDSRRSLPGVSC